MALKRGFFPFFILLSLSALVIFSLYHSTSLPLSSSPPTIQSPLKNFNKPQNPNLQNSPNFSINIKVLTYDRLPSLSRCLGSLSAAHYDNDIVDIHIFIDHFKVLDQNDDGSVYLDQKLNESRRILDFVDGFEWRFGKKVVHYRTANVGLQAQWLEAWWPVSDDEFAFVVEDDIEVSPLYYRFLRGLIVNYYYNASNFSPWIYGASLQRPRFVPGKHGNKIHLEEGTRLFLYQLVGTWGQLLFPRTWKEFRLWYDTHKTKNIKPILDGMVTTGWYKKMGDRIWTPWFIKFIHSRGYFNIYTNFLHETALSVSHRDAGVNYGKTAGPDSNLLRQSSPNFLEMQPLSNLKWYDFCFREVLPDRIVSSFRKLEPVLKSTQKSKSLVLVSLYGMSKAFVHNLLCQFERLNIRNYIFIGQDYSFLLDLARRGHPVIDVGGFFDSVRSKSNKLTRFEKSKLELVKENFVKAYVIKTALELKYDIWVLDENMVPIKGGWFLDPFDSTVDFDFYVSSSFRLFFARSSSSAVKVWTDDLVYEIARMIESKMSNFAMVLAKVLESKGVKLQKVNDVDFGVKIDENRTYLGNATRFVFWSSDKSSNLVQERLEKLGLWVVDGESQCTAVICHPS